MSKEIKARELVYVKENKSTVLFLAFCLVSMVLYSDVITSSLAQVKIVHNAYQGRFVDSLVQMTLVALRELRPLLPLAILFGLADIGLRFKETH